MENRAGKKRWAFGDIGNGGTIMAVQGSGSSAGGGWRGKDASKGFLSGREGDRMAAGIPLCLHSPAPAESPLCFPDSAMEKQPLDVNVHSNDVDRIELRTGNTQLRLQNAGASAVGTWKRL